MDSKEQNELRIKRLMETLELIRKAAEDSYNTNSVVEMADYEYLRGKSGLSDIIAVGLLQKKARNEAKYKQLNKSKL